MNTLTGVLSQIKSEKIKERQEGLNALRHVFHRDFAVAGLDVAGDGRAWLVVFQALFTAVANEKAAYTKKEGSKKTAGTTTAVIRRLGDAASVVRWLTERSVQRMNKKVYKALLSHLLQTMIYRGELFTPVALDYVKALRCLVAYPPHLDHLEDDSWVGMIELSFNVVLGDPVRRSLQEETDERPSSNSDLDDTDLYDEDEVDASSTSTQARKRRRADSTSAPRQTLKRTPVLPTQPVSLEQIEFTSLLAALLQSGSTPLLSSEYSYLPGAIISRLQRFIHSHSGNTSLHHDFLSAVSATLSHLALNKRELVSKFAWEAWEILVGMWTTRIRSLKEKLVAVLRTLFPFVCTGRSGPTSNISISAISDDIHGDGLGKLWHLLDAEAESRWGIDPLSLDSLRLQLECVDDEEPDSLCKAFMARTFRSCWHFDAGQALAWAVLELQADCAEKLYLFSESVHSGSTTDKGEGKRVRRDNPITSILTDIKVQTDVNIRTYRLQTLLFLIDRHWSVLHDSLQDDVITTLSFSLSPDDPSIQSWVLLCFAAIAHDDGASFASPNSRQHTRGTTTWEPIWMHAMRRACVPNVCRAASHTAHVLLTYSKYLLTSQRVLVEIENFAKDLEVQGPTFPYDSVSMFLTLCLKVASQDVRLYRMQLEERTLTWILDTWRIMGDRSAGNSVQGRTKSRLPSHTIKDVMLLLECICGLSKRSDIVCRRVLPDCEIVEAVVEERRNMVIQNFLIHARVPAFRPNRHFVQDLTSGANINERDNAGFPKNKEFVQPLGRERRVSAYLLKSLDSLVEEWETNKEGHSTSTAERARGCLDLAVVALYFESVLHLNGTRSNRRAIQAACRLIGLITPVLTGKGWTPEEKMLILLGLEPLISVGDNVRPDRSWDELLSQPDEGTGIKRKILTSLKSYKGAHRAEVLSRRRELQRIIFQSADVQDLFTNLLDTLKSVIRGAAGASDTDPRSPKPLEADEGDDFAPIRTSQAASQPGVVKSQHDFASLRSVRVCIAFLALVPILQSTSGEPTRDKELADVIVNSNADTFQLLALPYFDTVREGFLNLSASGLDKFLEKLGGLLPQYTFGRSEALQLTTIHILDSVAHIWLKEPTASSMVGQRVRELCQWFSNMLTDNKIRSWRVRFSFACFMDGYLDRDPMQYVWSLPPEGSQEAEIILPSSMLPHLAADEDIRIRSKMATINARSLSPARLSGQDATTLYGIFKAPLCNDSGNYEHMLTRLLYMANVMIVSSPLRRGAYWHVLELAVYATAYNKHIESILRSVADRMGLSNYSSLFESYASQLAYSISKTGNDFSKFPPLLLGYSNRREYAEAAFHAFSPIDLLAEGPDDSRGQQRFASHCKAIQRTVADGILECFANIVGHKILMWTDAHLDDPDEAFAELEQELKLRTKGLKGDFHETLQNHVDGIVIAILHGLGDRDFGQEGHIVQRLRAANESERTIRVFQKISRHRSMDDFQVHEPNLPSCSTTTVVRALRWFQKRVPDTDSAATTFHVLHRMFAEVQQSLIVNEQLRLINGISIWVSTHYHHFRDPTLLRSLVQLCAVSMSQFDLARAAQSMMEWMFALYLKYPYGDPRLPGTLISVGCLAHSFATDREDKVVASLGAQLLHWVEGQALEFCKVPSLRELVLKALPAWPTDPGPGLASLLEDISAAKLSAILADRRMSSNKFRLVRRLHYFASEQGILGDNFAQSDFWRLKSCIPPLDQLQEDDIDAFSALLVCQKGEICSFGVEPTRTSSILEFHRRAHSLRKIEDAIISPRGPIIKELLGLLEVNDAAQLRVAYTTLRHIMSVLPNDAVETPQPTPEHKEQEFLRAYPYPPCRRPSCDMTEVLQRSSCVDMAGDFSTWVTTIATLLSDTLASQDQFYAQFASILQSDVTFAEQVLPVLVQSILQMDLPRQCMNDPNSYSKVLSKYFTTLLNSSSASTACIRCIVDVVLHLRHFRPPSTKDPLAHDKWLDLDFLLLSRNAIACGAYTTALLFLELAAEHNALPMDETTRTERILFDIYSHIDEPDGFYGIKTHDLRNFLVKRFHHEKQWDKAFRFHGAALEAGSDDPAEAEGVLQSLHSFGFNNLAINALQSATGAKTVLHSSEMTYHLGWRAETWDLPGHAQEQHFVAPLYLAIRAIYRERDPNSIDATVRHCLFDQMSQLRALGDENLVEIRQVTQNLMCLNQVRQWRADAMQRSLANKEIDFRGWKSFFEVSSDFDFSSLEAIMATRISLIRSVREKEEREQIGSLVSPFMQRLVEVEKKCLLSLSEAAREAHNLQVALNSIVRAQKLEVQASSAVSQEFANVLWLHKEEKLAVQFLKEFVLSSRHSIAVLGLQKKLKNAVLLARLGTWTSEACLEKPTDILSHFFEPAVASLSKIDHASLDREQATVFHQCAMFAEQQYYAILRSPDAIRWKVYVDRKIQEIESRRDEIGRLQHGSMELSKLTSYQRKAETLLKQDRELFQQHNHAMESFLEQAIDMYSRSLEASDEFDDDGTIRMCSLWFANFDNINLQPKVRVALGRVASRKFVFLAHQLSARLTSSSGHSISLHQENLQSLIVRMCKEHPFHSLYQVYCLRTERTDTNTQRRHSTRHEQSSSQERAAAAGDIFDKLRTDAKIGQIALDVERVCDACLQWAKYPIKNARPKQLTRPLYIPETLQIRQIQQVRVPVLTCHQSLDPALRYDNCVWIERFENTYETAGGVNLPKIVYCLGSNGQRYKQLFKGEGEDDMRQDAVMEQVFQLVNVVLRRDRETKRRNLSIRGYCVIPLAAQAGVLEFVENTTTLQSWLGEAHRRYHPRDITPQDVSMILKKKWAEVGGQEEALTQTLTDIRKRFKPVMRHYFTERHKTPMAWFSMRLSYSRSVATTSIVGHILGLGDRHTSNILIDSVSGEVVHIDLGIAFDQGKLLPVPERVPFRLTPDIVDGLGTSGTQGVFQRCAEETLRVLRDGSDVILTVLEVFKYDPLHAWTASEIKIKRVQGGTPGGSSGPDTAQPTLRFGIGIDMASGSADEAADRALSSVTRKLDKSLSVEYTINQLIAEATDLVNLAMMFTGWSAYY